MVQIALCAPGPGELTWKTRYARERKIVLRKAPSIHCAPPGGCYVGWTGPLARETYG